jgi:hypothetical protein
MSDDIDELKSLCSEVHVASECGVTYYLLKGLRLRDGCAPASVDALLCPTPRDGYVSRLFFSERVTSSKTPNWSAQTVRILDRNWHVYSWKDVAKGRLVAMLASHLKAV